MTHGIIKFYALQSNVFHEESYAICSAYINKGGYLKSESYLFLNEANDKKTFHPVTISISEPPGTNCPITVNEEFMLREALEQAKSKLVAEAFEKNASKNFIFGPHSLKITEISKEILATLWISGSFKDSLESIIRITNHQDLGDFIYSLYELPSLRIIKSTI